MKKIAVVLLAAIALTGCSSIDGTASNDVEVVTVDVGGEDVTCIVYSGPSKGGLSCDWQGTM